MFHLAALLSTRAGFTPLSAHMVNVEGTLNLLEFARARSRVHGKPVIFICRPSIAVYGLPGRETRRRSARSEDEWTHPTTMYGCNKLYCRCSDITIRAITNSSRRSRRAGGSISDAFASPA